MQAALFEQNLKISLVQDIYLPIPIASWNRLISASQPNLRFATRKAKANTIVLEVSGLR
jgi:hypothetical protein